MSHIDEAWQDEQPRGWIAGRSPWSARGVGEAAYIDCIKCAVEHI